MIARIGLLMLFALSAATANGQPPSTIAVGLEDFQTAQHIRCQAVNGSYAWTVVKNGNLQTAGALEGIHRIAKTNRGFTVTTQEGNLEARYLILQPTQGFATLRLISEPTGYRQYTGAVHFYWHAGDWHVALETDLEDYVAGVLVSEIGKGHAEALYTAHAIVSRTYALNTFGRHRLEGYDVCDQVHCQAFDGVSTVNDTIRRGCRASKHLVLTDRLGLPIPAAFHSNCGGMTRSSDAVWQEASPHLEPVHDAACAEGAHARWERQIQRSAWEDWQLIHAADPTNAATAREAFNLPSDRFEVMQDGETTTLTGWGFGHGVGFCQEGAMKRAQNGASPWQLLTTYYQRIRLTALERVTVLRARAASGK
ncbi:MAG: SpoIID/LytB domain-containing protein [Flavobacteriales bacterium]